MVAEHALRMKPAYASASKRGTTYTDVENGFSQKKIDASFPEAARKFQQLIFPVDENYLRAVRVKKIAAYLKWRVRPLAWRLLPHGVAVWLSKRFSKI